MNIIQQITSIQNQYYNENKKNRIFKKDQKFECAEYFTKYINLDELIENTLYFVTNTNILICDYTIFKTFMYPEIYPYFNNHFVNMFQYGIDNFEKVNLYIQSDSFTVSAFERYRECIQHLINIIPYGWVEYAETITLFNCPSMIENILSLLFLLLDKNSKDNLKKKSAEELSQITGGMNLPFDLKMPF